MKDDRNDIVENLIVRSLSGEASAEEEKQLSAWIAQSEENERHYLGLAKAFELSKNYYVHQTHQDPDINVDQEWGHFVNQISKKEERTASRPPVTRARNFIPEANAPRLWLRVAAAIVLLVASGVMINYFVSGTDIHFQTADKSLSLSLSDGSQVILNRYSELSYTSNFGSKTRTVTLKGEAFFEVAHDPDRPFIIHVGDAEVEVLGTTFNVQGYSDQKELEVTVETGVVKLSAPGLKKEVKLRAGEKGIYSKTNQQVSSLKNDNANFLSWKTRKIVLIENDLRTAVATLNKAYGANIAIHTDVPVSCVVTVTFDHQSLEAALNVLKVTLNLTYRIQGNQIEITHAGC